VKFANAANLQYKTSQKCFKKTLITACSTNTYGARYLFYEGVLCRSI